MTSFSISLFPERKKLDGGLLAFQDRYLEQESSTIISFSEAIEPIDTLAFLQVIAQPNQLHFYWENRKQNEAIIAYGQTKSLMINSTERFQQAQQFIENCRQKTIHIGHINQEGSGAHLFCSFSFFPNHNSYEPFPTATIFLPKFQITRKQDKYILIINLIQEDKLDILREKIQNILVKCQLKRTKNPHPLNLNLQDNPQEFKKAVTSVLESIKEKKLSKVVIAHTLDVYANRAFNLIESLDNLRQKHPDCYIFSLSNGQGNYFIGASPERLISLHNQQLITDALAGSAPRGKTSTEDKLLAYQLLTSEKERREHQAVLEFILQQLTKIGLKPERSQLKILKLSNIQHLWTPIYAQVPSNINLLEIVSKLHPTPAVAGVPTPIACEQIHRYENFERSLYAAPLGWIDHQGNGKFIVGIRSALIKGNYARLYAGAGIVAGSNPDKEFAEVQLKFQSLLKSLA